MAVVVLVGLPGTGKTALATALAARRPGAAVLHTDLLKVTLRAAGRYPAGPAWVGALSERLAAVRPFLAAHAAKATADGYDLIIEGTLALAAPGDTTLCLVVPEPVRAARIARKPATARRALEAADLGPYRDALARVPADRILDATRPVAALADEVAADWPG